MPLADGPTGGYIPQLRCDSNGHFCALWDAVPNSPSHALETIAAMRKERRLTRPAAALLSALYMLAWDDGFARLEIVADAEVAGLRGSALDSALYELVVKSMIQLRAGKKRTDCIAELLTLPSVDRTKTGLGWWKFYGIDAID